MVSNTVRPVVFHRCRDEAHWTRLRAAVRGTLLTDAASRGRYSTDASIYQVFPLAVLIPETDEDVRAAMDVCAELRVPVLARGAGSSQCGQTVGAALVIDQSKHLDRILAFDAEARSVTATGLELDGELLQLSAYA